MDTIFLVLERFNQYSDILRGRLIRALAEQYRVVVITPDLDVKSVERFQYVQHPNLFYHALSPRYPRVWRLTEHYIRKYFVRAFDDTFTTQYLYYWYPHRLWDRLLRDAGALLPKRLFLPSFFTRLEMAVTRPSAGFVELVRRYRPVLVVTATAGFGYMPSVTEAVIFSRQLELPTVAINNSFDNPYTMPKFVRKTDYIMVSHPWMKERVERFFFYPPREIYVAGCLKFDHYFEDQKSGRLRSREEFLRSKGLDPSKKLVVYATPTPGTYKPREKFMRDLIGLKRAKRFIGDANILVRLHPFDSWDVYEEFVGTPGVHIERSGAYRGEDGVTAGPTVEMGPRDLQNQTETFLYADVLVNYASTTLVEACIFDTPVVSIAWPKQQGYAFQGEVGKGLVATGAARLAYDRDGLASRVNEYLEHPEQDRDQRRRVVEEYVYFTDGLSYQRTVNFIQDIIGKQKSISKASQGIHRL